MDSSFWNDKEILITGGTGSLGKILVKTIMKNSKVRGIRIFSRDELKQWELQNELQRLISEGKLPRTNVSFLIGDIRDKDRLILAMRKTDIVIHTAAMKQIPACEYNPKEAMLTNIVGSQNIVDAALITKPEKVILISTDKANQPLNFYGATKMCAEKIFLFGNVYTGGRQPIFSCCRYGNVLGSRGSVVPLFKEQIERDKRVTITDMEMSRFWITLSQVADFVLSKLEKMHGAEIFIPKMPSSTISDIVYCILKSKKMTWDDISVKIIGLREGEKLHETLINKSESHYSVEFKNYYIITRELQLINHEFTYNSSALNNNLFLDKESLYNLIIKSGEINES